MNRITNEPESAATPAVSGARFRAPNGGQLGSYILIWIYCNPLTPHKTAKRFLGKAWHWNHTSLEMFGEKAWSEARVRPVAGPTAIVIALAISDR